MSAVGGWLPGAAGKVSDCSKPGHGSIRKGCADSQ